MHDFRPGRASFRVNSAGVRLPILEIPVSEVAPCWRELSHGVFNDHPIEGTARERVLRILQAFRDDIALPPVELVRADDPSVHRFQLHHGAHRLYCAIAAGYSAVPALDVTDELAKI